MQLYFKYGTCHNVVGELKREEMKTAWLVITSIISLRKYFRNIIPNRWSLERQGSFYADKEMLMGKLLNYVEVLQQFSLPFRLLLVSKLQTTK